MQEAAVIGSYGNDGNQCMEQIDSTESEGQAVNPPVVVTPPFTHYQENLITRKRLPVNPAIWAVAGALALVIFVTAGYYVLNFTRNDFRTLDSFPVEEFLHDHERVLGSRFKSSLIVDAELGGSINEGRLYSFREETSQRHLAVLVPSVQSQMQFVKGQTYIAELEVGQGGVIYARHFQKK